MHHESKKADFIVYRSHNWSLKRISTEIGVCLRTLVQWNRELDDAIHLTRHLNADDHFQNLVEARQKDLDLINLRQNAIDKELAARDLGDIPTDKLIRLAIISREEQLQARSDTSSLAQRHHFIPDLLAFRTQTPAPKTPETADAQPQEPASVQPESTISPPEPAVTPNPEAAPATEPAQEQRTNDAK